VTPQRLHARLFRKLDDMIKDVEDLEVYNRSMNLLPSVYRLANSLPKSEFKRKRQLTDAAGAISAQITEGFAKRRSEGI